MTLPPQITYIEPDLQAQDGTFYGIVDYDYSGDDFLAKFDLSGHFQWNIDGDYAKIATADNGVIGTSGIAYDQNGNATSGPTKLPTES